MAQPTPEQIAMMKARQGGGGAPGGAPAPQMGQRPPMGKGRPQARPQRPGGGFRGAADRAMAGRKGKPQGKPQMDPRMRGR